jgi:hypothetical protein
MSTLSNKELYVLSSNTYSNMLNITKSKNIYDCIYDTDIDNTAALYSFCKFYNTKEILLCNEEFMEEHQTRIKFIQSFNSMKKEQQSNMILLDVVFRNIIELFYGLLKRCGYNILFQYGIHSNNLQTVIKNSNAYRDTMDGNKLLMTKEDIIETAECYKIPLVDAVRLTDYTWLWMVYDTQENMTTNLSIGDNVKYSAEMVNTLHHCELVTTENYTNENNEYKPEMRCVIAITNITE